MANPCPRGEPPEEFLDVGQNMRILPRVGRVRVTKITGSRSDEWIYWRSFTITLNSDSLQSLTVHDSLHSLLDHKRLLF
jgi:hypothetical protein